MAQNTKGIMQKKTASKIIGIQFSILSDEEKRKASMAEITRPFSSWDAPDFSNDILGLKFIRDSAADYARRNDFSSPVAVKYHTTNNFLLSVLGEELYRWGEHASLPKNFYGKDDQEAP